MKLGESPEDAVRRKVLDETGLNAEGFRFSGYYVGIYPTSAFGVPCHTVSLVFEGEASGQIVLNSESYDYGWFDKLPDDFYVQRS